MRGLSVVAAALPLILPAFAERRASRRASPLVPAVENAATVVAPRTSAGLPADKFYGVNYGNYLVMEPWMTPTEWLAMGGEDCGDCSTCRKSEWSLATFLGQEKTNEVFQKHWQSWLTQDDVNQMVAANLNSVRLPLGFWVIEDLVDRKTEPYAQGGLDELIRGLNMFKNAGIHVVLDQHAMPGVSSDNQMFAGNCTHDVQFYSSPSDYNYKRAVAWSAVLTWLTHTHPAFGSVFSIEAINEPTQDASQTPGLDRYNTAFVQGVRAIELALGVSNDIDPSTILSNQITVAALATAAPIIAKLSAQYALGPFSTVDIASKLNATTIAHGVLSDFAAAGRTPIVTQFMNQGWQHNGAAQPANAARGPQFYDAHQYLNFGGVAPQATEQSYLQTICTSQLISSAIADNNGPIVGGEWSLETAFNTSTSFLKQYADAQKLLFASNGGSGWFFWAWKVEADIESFPILGHHLQWSYKEALAAGIFTADPSTVNDPNVCAGFA